MTTSLTIKEMLKNIRDYKDKKCPKTSGKVKKELLKIATELGIETIKPTKPTRAGKSSLEEVPENYREEKKKEIKPAIDFQERVRRSNILIKERKKKRKEEEKEEEKKLKEFEAIKKEEEKYRRRKR